MEPEARTDQYVLCIATRDCDDLELGKVYRVVPDHKAADEDYIRVVDESGEDYLYPAAYFVLVELPERAREALGAAG